MDELQVLKEKRAILDAEIKYAEQQQILSAENEILKIALAFKINLSKLAKKQRLLRPKKSANKNHGWVHPDNNLLFWSGKGRRPAWLKEFLKENTHDMLIRRVSFNDEDSLSHEK